MSTKRTGILPVEQITRSILAFRGHRVLLDSELAELYGVPTKALNQAVKRNIERFPKDFMFRLSRTEARALMRSQSVTASHRPMRSQFVTASRARRNERFAPYVFTEHGSIMAATILNSSCAVEMSIYVVRAFVQLRELLASNKQLARRLDEMQKSIGRKFGSYDQMLSGILDTLRELQKTESRPIGFTATIPKK
jgi:hypothetical protein